MAANGYPGSYKKGTQIDLSQTANLENTKIFHAGTKKDGENFLANGGRVLNVIGFGNNLDEAKKQSYKAVDLVIWEDGFCRNDIGS